MSQKVSARRGRAAGGFTLIELLVVIFIIVILVTIAVPAVRSLTKSNAQKQAVNLITTMAAEARALAIRQHAPAAVVIYDFVPAVKMSSQGSESQFNVSKSRTQSYAQIVVCDPIFQNGIAVNGQPSGGNVQNNLRLALPPNTTSQPLPGGVIVATLNGVTASLNFDKNKGGATSAARIILFDEAGKLWLRGNLASANGNSSDSEVATWQITGGDTDSSSPGFLVFSGDELKAAQDAGAVSATNASLANWIEQNSDVVIFNTYTGNVIR